MIHIVHWPALSKEPADTPRTNRLSVSFVGQIFFAVESTAKVSPATSTAHCIRQCIWRKAPKQESFRVGWIRMNPRCLDVSYSPPISQNRAHVRLGGSKPPNPNCPT